HDARRCRRGAQLFVGARVGIGFRLRGIQLRLRALHLRLRLGPLVCEFGRVELREQRTGPHARPAIHANRFHEPWHARIDGDAFVRIELPGHVQGDVHRPLHDTHDIDRGRPGRRGFAGSARRLAPARQHGRGRQRADERERTAKGTTAHHHSVSPAWYEPEGSSGSSDADRVPAACCTSEKTDGSTKSVATVAAARPPTTARPSGAVASAPSPMASAIGIIPAIIAALVISTGRIRARAAAMEAETASAPRRRAASANVTRRIAFATATPIAMMPPMNDWTLSVVFVAASISATPASTAGTVETTTSASRSD